MLAQKCQFTILNVMVKVDKETITISEARLLWFPITKAVPKVTSKGDNTP